MIGTEATSEPPHEARTSISSIHEWRPAQNEAQAPEEGDMQKRMRKLSRSLSADHGHWARKESCAINPEESRFSRYWDWTTALCLVFVCFMSPYEIAFHQGSPSLDFLFFLNR